MGLLEQLNRLKTGGATHNRLKDPHVSLLDEFGGERWWPEVGRGPWSADLAVGTFASSFHVAIPNWL